MTDGRPEGDGAFAQLVAGFRLGRRTGRPAPTLAPPTPGDPRPAPLPPPPLPPVAQVPVAPPPVAPVPVESDDPEVGLVRPYAWTGGRTRASVALRVETLVSSTGPGRHDELATEHRTIAAFCAEPRSVAEVAVRMAVPLGVARVLISDMAELDLLLVHGDSDSADDQIALMERVLSGLRRL